MTSTMHQPARRATEPKSSVGRLDVDRELSAQYLAAVVRELDKRGLQVDTAVLHHPAPARDPGLIGGSVFSRPSPTRRRVAGCRCVPGGTAGGAGRS